MVADLSRRGGEDETHVCLVAFTPSFTRVERNHTPPIAPRKKNVVCANETVSA